MATTGLSGSPAASSSAQGRGSAAAFTGDHSMTATSVDGGILTITGAGSTDAENSMTAATSAAVSVAAKTSTAAVAGTFTVAETSTAEAHSAEADLTVAADSMAEAMVAVGSMVAATADAGKFPQSSTPQTAGSTLCRPFPFWVRIRCEIESYATNGLAKTHTTRNALVVATVLGMVECG